jgi:hypothetical protein
LVVNDESTAVSSACGRDDTSARSTLKLRFKGGELARKRRFPPARGKQLEPHCSICGSGNIAVTSMRDRSGVGELIARYTQRLFLCQLRLSAIASRLQAPLFLLRLGVMGFDTLQKLRGGKCACFVER